MAEAAPTTIELPAIPKAPTPGTATPEAPAGRTPVGKIFDRARESQMPTPEVEPKSEVGGPATAGKLQSEGQTQPEPTKADVTELDPFVPPEIFTGEPGKETAPAKEPGVAELMPEEPPVAIRTEKGRADYKKWREHQISLETKVKDFEAKLKTQPAPDANLLAQNELLTQRLQEMSGVVERADLLSHPAFQNQFVKPRQEALDAASQLLKDAELDPSMLNRALNATGKERIKAMDDLNESIESPTVRMKLIDLFSKIEHFDQQQAAAMADVKGANERLQREDRARRHLEVQEQTKQYGVMADTIIEGLRDKLGLEFYKKAEGKEEWNTGVDTRVAAVKRIVTDGTPEELCAAVALGATALDARNWALSEQRRRVAAEKELAELTGALPNLEGEGAGAGAGENGSEERSGIGAIVDRITKGSGGAFGS